jgi:hypothetical protein
MCEPYSDIMAKWRDMRSKFGYTTLSASLKETMRIGVKIRIGG